jgi:hypothetical protein
MLKKLTKAQEDALPAWGAKWDAINLCTEPADWEKAEAAIRVFYDLAKLPQVPIIRVPSPRVGALAAPLTANANEGLSVHPKYLDDPHVGPAIRAAAKGEVRSSTDAPPPWWHHWYGGQFWAYFAAYGTFFRDVCQIPIGPALDSYASLVESAGYIWPNRHFCMVTDRPTELHLKDLRLHKDGGKAIRYPDGWGSYFLHGVRVPEWLAVTPAEQIDPTRLHSIDNEEVRREFVRKVGADVLYQRLGGETLEEVTMSNDTGDHPYKLVLLAGLPYLWMENPSLRGTFHLERVPMGTTTFRKAWLFRINKTEADIDEASGADWIAQGDVLLFPKGKKIKFFPKVLT